ncbi:MAG: hypothetical protein CMJ65_02515 [Planctomycetaceae bacterium]|nr:hypothetical protein [Planctomycetaceae bacterium]
MPDKTIRLPVLRVVCGFWYALLVFSAVPGLLSPQHCHAGPRLNVVLITVDDMNCDSVGVFGCPIPGITPHIDRLASQGLRFEHAHVTIAICQPTRAVWMTGRFPHRSGALGFDPIRTGVPTLLEALKAGGYYTGILAKVSHVVPTRGSHWDLVVQAKQLKTGRDPKLYHAHTVRFLKQAAAANRPFFLMANSQDPHRPFAGSQQERNRKRPRKKRRKDQPKKAKAKKTFAAIPRTFTAREVPVPGFLPDLPSIRQELSEYYASVHRADQIVGSVLRALDEAGVRDNTLVMFLSDHGMPLPFAKTNCWRHSTRTPWIVRWPGTVKPGQHDRHHMVGGIDLAPTILAAVGLPPLADIDGRSFVPVLRGSSQTGRDHVITHINRTAGKREFPMRSVIERRFGYIFNAWSDGKTTFRNESQSGLTMNAMKKAAADNPQIAARVRLFLHRTAEELYDYKNDPDALRNLVDDPSHRQTLRRLRRQLQQHMTLTNDPQLAAFRRQLQSP